jgi:hypothetical protein
MNDACDGLATPEMLLKLFGSSISKPPIFHIGNVPKRVFT